MTKASSFPASGAFDASIHVQGLLSPAWSLDLSCAVAVALLSFPPAPRRMRLSARIKCDCTK